MTLSGRLRSALSSRAKQGRQRSLTPTSSGRQLVDFSSNDYLSLSTCPQLRSVLLHRLQSQPQIYGPASSRLLDGNTSAHEFLEQHLSTFFHAPSALLFNSGFDANVALFTTIPGPDDFVLYDALIHASVHDGMRASRTLPSRRRSFSHNSVQSLSRELQLAKAEMPSSFSCIFVAVEALYSMDGDTCPLQEMLQAVDDLDLTHSVYFILDEAHSTGTFGPCGRGWAAKLGVEDRIAIRLHTFGKAMASQGAAVLCDPLIRTYLINYARPLIYSTVLPTYAVEAIHCALRHLSHPSTMARQSHLHALAQHVRRTLQLPPSESPIIPYLCSQSRDLAQHIQQAGFMVRPIVWPTVEKGQDRIRICLHAGNTQDEVDGLLHELRSWNRQSKL